nr:hypothetical protein [Pseudanabaena sp. PCC 6802]
MGRVDSLVRSCWCVVNRVDSEIDAGWGAGIGSAVKSIPAKTDAAIEVDIRREDQIPQLCRVDFLVESNARAAQLQRTSAGQAGNLNLGETVAIDIAECASEVRGTEGDRGIFVAGFGDVGDSRRSVGRSYECKVTRVNI